MSTPDSPLEHDVAAAIAALTAAAQRTYPGRGEESRYDFGEIVTRVLAAVAANVGGVEQLLAGRPGSWEADGVRSLLHSTVGEGEERLLEYRTEPISVWLDVETQLEEQTAGQWDAAWQHLEDAAAQEYEDAYKAARDRLAGDARIVSSEDRARIENTLSRLEPSADVNTIWARLSDEAQWLESEDPGLAAARRLVDAVAAAREARETDYRGLLFAAMQAAAVGHGWTVDLTPTSDYNADNWLGNELEAEARAATPVPAVPTLDELRATPTTAGE